VPLVVLGTLILAFGWFGFNPGSTLAGTEQHVAVIALNTMIASGAGAVSAYLYTKLRYGMPDVTMMCNGLLAGLVAITGPCAFVTSLSAMIIGGVAGLLVVRSALFIEHTLRIDDPVGAVSVHGVCGAWGIVALGLFADGRYGEGFNGVDGPVRGLVYGDAGQLVASLVGIATNVCWVGGASYVALKIIDAMVGNRSRPQDELDGLDVSEMGGPGYAPDSLAKRPPPPVALETPAPARALLRIP
jgi:Amt family ammonium transporter